MCDLTIIVVSYNTVELLQECLESVCANSDGLNFELFVVDNFSTDGSAEMVKEKFPKTRLICNSKNMGFAAANNQAMHLAKGRHVLLLNSDTFVLDNVLLQSVQYMDSNPGIGVLGCRVLNSDRTLQLACTQFPTLVNLFLQLSGLSKLNWPRWCGRFEMKHWDHTTARDVNVVSGCFLMARHAAIAQVGLLDESFFFYGEETDWCRRFSNSGWRVSFAPVGEIIHHGEGSTSNLGYERDLLLTTGLIRYHWKHGGLLSAVLVWIMLYAFAATRFFFWTVVNALFRTDRSALRREHFLGILLDYSKAWPSSLL